MYFTLSYNSNKDKMEKIMVKEDANTNEFDSIRQQQLSQIKIEYNYKEGCESKPQEMKWSR